MIVLAEGSAMFSLLRAASPTTFKQSSGGSKYKKVPCSMQYSRACLPERCPLHACLHGLVALLLLTITWVNGQYVRYLVAAAPTN